MPRSHEVRAVDGRPRRPPATAVGSVGAPAVSSGGAGDELLSIGEVALIVRVPVATLRYWRYLGTGPHSFRVGRAVRYWRSEVEDWLHEQSTPTRPGQEPG